MTRYGKQNYAQINFKDIEEDIYLVFGKESTVSIKILANNLIDVIEFQQREVRSINLANAAALVSYEVYRMLLFSLSFVEPEIYKGKDF